MAAGKHAPPSRRSHIHRLRTELTFVRNSNLKKPLNPQNGDMWLEASAGTARLKVRVNDQEITLASAAYNP